MNDAMGTRRGTMSGPVGFNPSELSSRNQLLGWTVNQTVFVGRTNRRVMRGWCSAMTMLNGALDGGGDDMHDALRSMMLAGAARITRRSSPGHFAFQSASSAVIRTDGWFRVGPVSPNM